MPFTEANSHSSEHFVGNPHFNDAAIEGPELAQAQLKNKIETVLDELESAQARVELTKSDETIDPVAAENLVNQLQAEYAVLDKEWTDLYGAEQVH